MTDLFPLNYTGTIWVTDKRTCFSIPTPKLKIYHKNHLASAIREAGFVQEDNQLLCSYRRLLLHVRSAEIDCWLRDKCTLYITTHFWTGRRAGRTNNLLAFWCVVYYIQPGAEDMYHHRCRWPRRIFFKLHLLTRNISCYCFTGIHDGELTSSILSDTANHDKRCGYLRTASQETGNDVVVVFWGDLSGMYVEKLLRNIFAETELTIVLKIEVDDDDDDRILGTDSSWAAYIRFSWCRHSRKPQLSYYLQRHQWRNFNYTQ